MENETKQQLTAWNPQRERIEGIVYCDVVGGIHDDDGECHEPGEDHYAVYRDIAPLTKRMGK